MWNSRTFVEEDPSHQQVTKKFKVCPTVYCKWSLDWPLMNSGIKQTDLICCYKKKKKSKCMQQQGLRKEKSRTYEHGCYRGNKIQQED